MKKIIEDDELMREWLYVKNDKLGLDPTELVIGSGKKAWWKCKDCGHEWFTQIYLRQKHNCPRCGAKKLGEELGKVKDSNRLTTIFPDVAKCWNYEKNGDLKPEQFAAGSNKKVWWKCSRCGKEWQAEIWGRTKAKRTTCRDCTFKTLERSYVKSGVNDLASSNKRVLAEWNYEKNGDLRPENVAVHSETKAWWKCEKGHEWKASILSRTKDGYRGCPICANIRVIKGVNDLETIRPELAERWNYEKNGDLRPDSIGASSNKKVWWKCEKGHEWEVSPNNVGQCPFCLNQKVWRGFNDLATVNPELAKEWNYEKNGDLKPEDIIAGSGRKVWWKCEKGHEWEAKLSDRKKGHSCPVCANRIVSRGFNDLATVNPELAKEWNYEKNGDLKPEDIIAGSPKKVWWKCEKGHEWEAVIASRNKDVHCPVCFSNRSTSMSEKAIGYYLEKYGLRVEENKKINGRELDVFIPSLNMAVEYDGQYYHRSVEKDLAKNRLCHDAGIKLIRIREPKLPALDGTSIDIRIRKLSFDFSHLNEPLRELLIILLGPDHYDVDVKRDYGEIYSRYQRGEVEKSLANTHPELLREWNYEKNTVDPSILTEGSKYDAWWKCGKCGHEWRAVVYSRAWGGCGCRKCGIKRSAEFRSRVTDKNNSLLVKNHELAKEWNYEKNGDLRPEDVNAGSNKKVWWKCEKGHEWEAPIANRMAGRSCPICANRILLHGYNDLVSKNPELAKEWNYEKNGDLKPEDVVEGSGKKVWWKCEKGHEWEASIADRKHGRGCPYCSNRFVLRGYNDFATFYPELAKEWNYEKNGDLKPEDIVAGSPKKVWWKCSECGKEWEAAISNRIRYNSPLCQDCKKKAR